MPLIQQSQALNTAQSKNSGNRLDSNLSKIDPPPTPPPTFGVVNASKTRCIFRHICDLFPIIQWPHKQNCPERERESWYGQAVVNGIDQLTSSKYLSDNSWANETVGFTAVVYDSNYQWLVLIILSSHHVYILYRMIVTYCMRIVIVTRRSETTMKKSGHLSTVSLYHIPCKITEIPV